MGPSNVIPPAHGTLVSETSREIEAELRAARDDAVVADASTVGVLVATGADAGTFLQSQLSSNVGALGPGDGQWTSYNSPKGRMLATAFLYRPADGAGGRYVALVASDLVDALRKRLAMFVLRSKVMLADETGRYARLGVGGPRAAEVVRAGFGIVPEAGRSNARDEIEIVGFPDGRFVVLTPSAEAGNVAAELAEHAKPAGPVVWDWLGIRAGVPTITKATQDLFVAQTANWDAIGGLDFRKGCYPGQEIVARTQYLGRLKERLFPFRCARPAPEPATRLYSTTHGDQACGTVVNSAPDPSGAAVFLAVVQIEGTDAVTIGAPDGPAATREPPPYAIPAAVAPPGRVRL